MRFVSIVSLFGVLAETCFLQDALYVPRDEYRFVTSANDYAACQDACKDDPECR